MKLRNRHGTPVDAVPFVVVSGLGFLLCFSYGPIYLMELGVSLQGGLLACLAVTALIVLAAYHRYVWTLRPEMRSEVPAAYRLKRLFYGALAGVGVLALLAIPLFVR